MVTLNLIQGPITIICFQYSMRFCFNSNSYWEGMTKQRITDHQLSKKIGFKISKIEKKQYSLENRNRIN